MIQIGDKVKFDTYLIKNILTGQNLKVSLDKISRFNNRSVIVVRNPLTTEYIERINKDSKVHEGIYIGSFRKKLIRKYHRTENRPRDVFPDPFMLTRKSTSSARIDDPNKLDKMALISFNRKILGVPMTNIYKCNYSHLIRIL